MKKITNAISLRKLKKNFFWVDWDDLLYKDRVCFNKGFAFNSKYIAFADDGFLFLGFFTLSNVSKLTKLGFREEPYLCKYIRDIDSSGVFSWNRKKAKEKKQLYNELHGISLAYAYENSIKAIDDNSLRDFCIKIPRTGIHVLKGNLQRIYYPVVKDNVNSILKVGHYNINESVCVFVNRDGETYITSNFLVIDSLKHYNYKEDKSLLVPLSYNEVILDQEIAKKWEEISTIFIHI